MDFIVNIHAHKIKHEHITGLTIVVLFTFVIHSVFQKCIQNELQTESVLLKPPKSQIITKTESQKKQIRNIKNNKY